MPHTAFARALLGAIIFTAVLVTAYEVYGPDDAAALRSLILSKAGPAGDFGGSLEDAYYSLGALTLLNAKDELQTKALCGLAAAQLSSMDANITAAFHAADILNTCRCSDEGSTAKAEKLAAAALETEVPDMLTGYQALATLASLGRSASQKALQNGLLPIQKLKASKGQLQLVPKGSASLTATAHGYLAVAQAKRLGSIGKDILPAVEELLAEMPQVLETASKRISHAEGSSVLEAASRLVQGMAAACAEPCSLDVQQLGALAKLLTRAKAAGSVQDACHVLAGLTALSTTGSLPKPVALELDTPTVPQGKAEVSVLVRDFTGNPADVASLNGALKGSGKKAAAGDLTFAAERAGLFKASLQTLDLSLGTYQLTVTAHGEGGKLATESFPLTVTGKVQLSSATVSVKNPETSSEKQQGQLQFSDSLSAPILLDHRSQLKVSFKVEVPGGKPFMPQQAFMILKSSTGLGTVLVAAKASKGSASDYTATATADIIAKQIGAQAGAFNVTLSVGDEALEEVVQWQLGAVNVTHAPGDSGGQRAAPAVSAALLDAAPKPEIHHMFRDPGKRPPAVLSLFFAAAAVVVPAAALLLRLSQLGVNLKGFPTAGAASTATVAFHAGIASILGMYAVFWLRLTLIDTLLPLAGLGVFTFLAGYKALSWHARQEAKPVGSAAGNGPAFKKD